MKIDSLSIQSCVIKVTFCSTSVKVYPTVNNVRQSLEGYPGKQINRHLFAFCGHVLQNHFSG